MATITTLGANDNGSDSRNTINTNFSNLNTDKLESSDIKNQTEVSTGWIPAGETWTYASATTFTISGVDLTTKYTKGTKIKLTNDSSVKYYYVVSSSFSTNTTVTVTGETDLVSGAITLPYYSYTDCPQGFKKGEDWYKARANTSSTEALTNNSTIVIPFDTTSYDPNSNFDTSNKRYDIPITGYYSVSVHATCMSLSASGKMGGAITLNGADHVFGDAYVVSGKNMGFSINDVVYAEKGDYITATIKTETGSNETLGGNSKLAKISVQFVGL